MRSVLFVLMSFFATALFAEPNEATNYEFVGRHLVASYHGCDKAALTDVKRLSEVVHEACRASGATILDSCQYPFDGNALTLVVLLSESHASIHTYPEHDACFVDIFTCGNKCSQEKFDAVLRAYLKPSDPRTSYIARS